MFVVRWVGRLLSLPFVWLGRVAATFGLPVSVPLLTAAWRLGGSVPVGVMALARIRLHRSLGEAAAKSAAWANARPAAGILGFAGLLALMNNDSTSAATFLARARLFPNDPDGWVDLLEYGIVVQSGDPQAVWELARRLEGRNDLPPFHAKDVRADLALMAMLNGQFDGARRRAERLIEIADNPHAELILWALAKRDGDLAIASAHLGRAKMPENSLLFHQVLGNLAAGFGSEALDQLCRLKEVDADLARKAEAYVAWMEGRV